MHAEQSEYLTISMKLEGGGGYFFLIFLRKSYRGGGAVGYIERSPLKRNVQCSNLGPDM